MKKILLRKFVFPAIAIIAILFACQKPYSYDSAVENSALYSLGSANDIACTGSVLTGTYTQGVLLNGDTLSLSVNVNKIGTYRMSTTTNDSISFSANGTFITLGYQTVKLVGYGIPSHNGIFAYRVFGKDSSCLFSVIVGGGGSGNNSSTFTLTSASGNCSGFTTAGIYTAGTTLTAANTAVTGVNVTAIGTYSITTNTVNGMSFTAVGTFTQTGAQFVTLKGTGNPLTAGANNYTASAGASSCTFSVSALPTAPPAVFTLGGAPNACTGFTSTGIYTAGTILNSTNSLTTQVNITTIGSYSIATNTVNGISFSSSGIFTTTGVQTITLIGTGTPTSAGANNYILTAGPSACTLSITTIAAPLPAAFTFICTGISTYGTNRAGVPIMGDYIANASVNVTNVGPYTINTSSVNGISFSGSGVFTTTGAQDIILTGKGTPIAGGSFNFTLGSGGNICTFSVLTLPAIVATSYITCNMDGVPMTFNINPTASLTSGLAVSNDPTSSSQITINIVGTGTAVNRTYTNTVNNVIATGLVLDFGYYDASFVSWSSEGFNYATATDPPDLFTINITSISATNVQGTFNGIIKNLAGVSKQVTNGVFNVPVK